MAIKLPDPGNGIPEDKTGYNEWENIKIVRENFADQSNAASRLVGTADGQVATWQLGIIEGIEKDSKTNLLLKSGDTIPSNSAASKLVGRENGQLVMNTGVGIQDTGLGSNNVRDMTLEQYNDPTKAPPNGFYSIGGGAATPYATMLQMGYHQTGWRSNFIITIDKYDRTQAYVSASPSRNSTTYFRAELYTTSNTTKDSNGFLKAASPVVDLYDDRIELNNVAEQQGKITFEKLGTGNYLVRGSLGFAQESWYIEMPKDANGNVLVAVAYEQLDNNDISVKTYDYMLNKKGRIIPDTETPLDIPEGRCINLRLHEEQLNEPIE